MEPSPTTDPILMVKAWMMMVIEFELFCPTSSIKWLCLFRREKSFFLLPLNEQASLSPNCAFFFFFACLHLGGGGGVKMNDSDW